MATSDDTHQEPALRPDRTRPLAERLAVGVLYGMGALTVLLAILALATKTPA
jgi:hypothetical protein